MLKLKKIENSEYEEIMPFMTPLWNETYKNILKQEQINFLLQKYFLVSSILSFIDKGYEYYYLLQNNFKCGIIVFQIRKTEVYLDKLYFLPEVRGKGYSKFIIEELKKFKKDIMLNVNQNNINAFNVYKALGFEIAEEQEICLDNGMINYDYKMILRNC